MKNNISEYLKAFFIVKIKNYDQFFTDLNNLYQDIAYSFKSYNSFDQAILRFKKEFKPVPKTLILVRLLDDWALLFDDKKNSDGCASILYNLNRIFKYEGFKVNHNEMGITFTYYRLLNKRVINVYFDKNKWIFYQLGEPLEFEDIENYKKKKISDRFNFRILLEYLKKMGINNINRLLLNSEKVFKIKIESKS
jgi:hypothetical protein